jgi:acetyltransferase-like isoleucine patch superfamily enzyme
MPPIWRRRLRGEGQGFRRTRTLRGLYPDVVIEQGVRIFHENTVEIGPLTYIAHGVLLHGDQRGGIKIGRGSWVGFDAKFFGQACIEIGEYVGIGANVIIMTGKHDVKSGVGPIINREQIWGKVVIKDGADIGCSAVIMPGVTIGKCAQIGAGAVICKDVPDYEIWVGVPGGRVGMVAGDGDG